VKFLEGGYADALGTVGVIDQLRNKLKPKPIASAVKLISFCSILCTWNHIRRTEYLFNEGQE
jgi:hypothetical protein